MEPNRKIDEIKVAKKITGTFRNAINSQVISEGTPEVPAVSFW